MITFGRVEEFKLFYRPHIVALIVIAIINLGLFVFRRNLRNSKVKNYIRIFIGLALIIQEISLNIFRIWNGTWDVATSLPLHLCGFAVIICSIMCLTKNEKLFSIVYFWAIGGATMALITPDLSTYGFPHYRFYQFFVSHGLIITSTIFMAVVERYRPTTKSFKKSILVLNMLMIPIGFVNYITGGNYFFIARPPATASLIDFLGPWPYYILWFEVLGLILFSLTYMPYYIIDKKAKRFSVNKLQF